MRQLAPGRAHTGQRPLVSQEQDAQTETLPHDYSDAAVSLGGRLVSPCGQFDVSMWTFCVSRWSFWFLSL